MHKLASAAGACGLNALQDRHDHMPGLGECFLEKSKVEQLKFTVRGDFLGSVLRNDAEPALDTCEGGFDIKPALDFAFVGEDGFESRCSPISSEKTGVNNV